MADAKPVDTKVDSAKAVDTAAALTDPTKVATAAAKAGSAAFRDPKRFGLVAGGAVVAIAAGWFGFKHFFGKPKNTTPPDEPALVAQAKTLEPTYTPPKAPEIPDIVVPGLPDAPKPGVGSDLPSVRIPTGRTEDNGPPPLPPVILPNLEIPPAPPAPMGKSIVDPDLFKATDAVPTAVTDKKEKPTGKDTPILRIGATDAPPPAPGSKSTIDVVPPPPPPPLVDVPVVMPPKNDTTPPLKIEPATGPSPMTETPVKKMPVDLDVPTITIPTKDDRIKSPMIPDTPTIDVAPMPMPRTVTPITIDQPPSAPRVPDKKDMYDEDWHTERNGDTFALVSKEYFKTADYAQALEAYNKDRRKSGEKIIRVPPTWVLEEQFPNLVGPKAEKPGVPEAKSPGGIRFEPVAPTSAGNRTAPPPPAATSNERDEYRVTNEAGETIRDIARRVYGDENAWKKLWDMNPGVDPTRPIPSGTTLRLAK